MPMPTGQIARNNKQSIFEMQLLKELGFSMSKMRIWYWLDR